MNENRWTNMLGGAVGAGLVLILLPCIALIGWMNDLADEPTVGLPILAIFGIMVLFGSLAMIASMFWGLDLTNRDQPLGLPDGSIRAAIALSLIVLFAIIAIMLHQSMSKPYEIPALTIDEKNALVRDPLNRVIAVVPVCPSAEGATPAPTCDDANRRFTVHVLLPEGREATDLAKQLLILIGTLMTSVTSFYFAARGNDPSRPMVTKTDERDDDSDGGGSPTRSTVADADDDADGCNVPIGDPTLDEDLPPAKGGVQLP